MDALSEILKSLRLKSAVYFNSDFSAPWGMEVPQSAVAQFHMITRGSCLLHTNNNTYQLFQGDIVVFPKGSKHWIADSAKSKRKNGLDVVQKLQNDPGYFRGDEISASLICGHFEFDHSLNHPLLDSLPEMIKLTDLNAESKLQIEEISKLIIKESTLGESGSHVASVRLSEVLFIQLLRGHIKANSSATFFQALTDPLIQRTLTLMHNQSEKTWTVELLAKEVGTSRTNFFTKFKSKVGVTPLKYLTTWRMIKAREILNDSDLPIGSVAEKIGYASEAAFIKVFKKSTNQTPSAFRKNSALL